MGSVVNFMTCYYNNYWLSALTHTHEYFPIFTKLLTFSVEVNELGRNSSFIHGKDRSVTESASLDAWHAGTDLKAMETTGGRAQGLSTNQI